ncbi:MAG: hypothetical protein AAB941_01875 [Patescibacteria group bacterium]
MNKKYIVSLLVVLSLVLTGVANAASTIGTNMSTTGTFTVTPATDSATSIRFQNAAGTNYFIANSTSSRIGIGAAPSTVFEVQGTASASYLMTANSLQVAGVASVAYSRFGTDATGHSLAATQDVLFSGLTEFNGNAFFDAKVGIGDTGPSTVFEVQGTASASYFFTQNTIQVAGVPGATASVAYSRFGTATTGHATDIDASNDLLLTGALEVDGNAFFDSKASVSGNFQTSGRVIADTAASHSFQGDLRVSSNLIIGAAAASSSAGLYVAEFVGGTGTASFYFGGTNASTTGSCFQLKSTTGAWIYMRFNQSATTPTLSTIRCQ